MEMNQIRYFLAICEHRNFTHAASASNVSQPSLTTAIKKLEEEMGGPLFIRDRAGCRLTTLGKLVRPRLSRIQSEATDAKADAVRHVRLDRVPISIGIGETIGNTAISVAVERFRNRFPEAEIELIIGSTNALLSGLRDGVHDILVTSAKVNSDLYKIDHLYRETYKVVVAQTHPMSRSEGVKLEDLAQANLLDRPNCEMRDTLHNTCAENGHTLYAAYRSNRVEWLLELARKGSGAVILPATAIPNDPELVSLEIQDLDISRDVSALRFRHQSSRPEAAELLRELGRVL